MSNINNMSQIYPTTISTISNNGCISGTSLTGSYWAQTGPTGSTTSIPQPMHNSLSVNGDIVMDGISLREFIKNINDRLMIITPDLEKMEKFEALRKAYDNYKLIEQLCTNNKNQESP